jgi:hypothetical protein
MNWVKRNLFLVVGGVAALALLGFAIFFLLTRKQAVDEVTAELTSRTEEWKQLVGRDPYPNQENIERAKVEQKKLAEFLDQTRKYFAPVATFPTNLDGATFKNLLETTIAELVRDAEKSGVSLPSSNRFDFTFKPQRSSLDFAPTTLVPLAMQVSEIKSICDVLFDARVHSLVGLRRAPVAKEDEGSTGSGDYLGGRKLATNAVTGAVLAPYEIVFHGFSTELAAVLEGFYRSPNCFIVKNVDVQTNVVFASSEYVMPSFMPSYYAPPPGGVPPPGLSPSEMMRQRYGVGGRYGRPPSMPAPAPVTPAVVTPTAPVRKGPETVLDERPLKITMYIEAVRLLERAKPKGAR